MKESRMSRESTYAAAKTLISEGWRAERATIDGVDGSKRQGWRWTDPTGGISYVVGKWADGPTKPKKVTLPPTWHMVFRRVTPRNEYFIRGTMPVPCPSCARPVAEGLMVTYRGEKCCPACFGRRKAEFEARLNAVEAAAVARRATLARRAIAHMEARLARQNTPEVCP
jgi:hypothetical protein